MAATGSGILLGSTQFFKETSVVVPSSSQNTTPGLSIKRIFLSNTTSCIEVVNPGVELTPTARERFKLLIMEDFPVFYKERKMEKY
jgi:hypothetical protein